MKKEDVVAGMLAYIAHLREVGRYSTAKSYLDALRSFKCFCGMEEIPYAYIDKERLLLYQAWLSKRGCMRNTVSTYMRRIRHIYNLAVEAGEGWDIPNMFKGSAGFRISRICSRGCLLAWRASGRRRCLWIACAR